MSANQWLVLSFLGQVPKEDVSIAEVELDALAVGRLFQADAVLRWSASSVSVAGVVPAALRDVWCSDSGR